MITGLKLFLFTLAAVSQLALPISMIMKKNHTLDNGKPFKFRTEPVDPYDPFKGKYVALRFDNRMNLSHTNGLSENMKVYASIKIDDEGFAQFKELLPQKPKRGSFICTKITSIYQPHNTPKYNVRIHLPFDRYYIDETKALAAEHAYWKHSRSDKRSAHVIVKVLDGEAVLEELYIEDLPVLEFLKKQKEKK